jgi:hypothetical protein
MNQPTAPSVARPASVFAPGGIQWVAIPVGLEGPARDVWGALMQLERSTTIITAPDWRIAEVIGRSARYVQEGLRALELAGMIERLRRHGKRVITIVARLAGRDRSPIDRDRSACTDSHRRAKPYRRFPATPYRTGAPAPSSEGINEKKLPGPPVAASTPAGPENEEPSPHTRRWFGRLIDVERSEAVSVLRD